MTLMWRQYNQRNTRHGVYTPVKYNTLFFFSSIETPISKENDHVWVCKKAQEYSTEDETVRIGIIKRRKDDMITVNAETEE